MKTRCQFCNSRQATNRTTEGDSVCRECAIEFELGMEYGDYYDIPDKAAIPAAQLAKSRAEWEVHLDKQAAAMQEDDELIEDIYRPILPSATYHFIMVSKTQYQGFSDELRDLRRFKDLAIRYIERAREADMQLASFTEDEKAWFRAQLEVDND